MNAWGVLKLVPRIFKESGEVQKKGWYASKTIWFNLLVLSFDVATKVLGHDLPITGEAIDAIAAGLGAVGNIFLRSRTSKPLGMKTSRQS